MNLVIHTKENYKQSYDELALHLKEQIRFLINSSKSFDEGFEGEGKRLAVAIRVLVHDTSKSRSLLGLLKKKDMQFYDTATDFNPWNLLSSNCLTAMRLRKTSNGAVAEYVPYLDMSPSKIEKVKFEEWWNKIIIVDKHHRQFTRKSLVLAVSNQDGGAHVDPSLDFSYAELSRLNSLSCYLINERCSTESIKNGPELPSIRQIAHEILKSLADVFPEYFTK